MSFKYFDAAIEMDDFCMTKMWNFCCETRRSLLQTAYNHEGESQQPV